MNKDDLKKAGDKFKALRKGNYQSTGNPDEPINTDDVPEIVSDNANILKTVLFNMCSSMLEDSKDIVDSMDDPNANVDTLNQIFIGAFIHTWEKFINEFLIPVEDPVQQKKFLKIFVSQTKAHLGAWFKQDCNFGRVRAIEMEINKQIEKLITDAKNNNLKL